MRRFKYLPGRIIIVPNYRPGVSRQQFHGTLEMIVARRSNPTEGKERCDPPGQEQVHQDGATKGKANLLFVFHYGHRIHTTAGIMRLQQGWTPWPDFFSFSMIANQS